MRAFNSLIEFTSAKISGVVSRSRRVCYGSAVYVCGALRHHLRDDRLDFLRDKTGEFPVLLGRRIVRAIWIRHRYGSGILLISVRWSRWRVVALVGVQHRAQLRYFCKPARDIRPRHS